MNANEWPTDATALAVVRNLVAGLATAPNQAALLFLRPLTDYLRCENRGAPPDLCDDAATCALMELILSPARYDHARGLSVERYLKMAARRDFQNLLEQVRRRAARAVSLDSVDFVPPARNEKCDTESPWADPRLAAEIAAFDHDDRIVFDLMCAGVSDTEACAVALGLTETGAARVAVVKRRKDKVKARLKRAVEMSHV
ncbi:MAG: hypothetical protein FJ304_09465 [Planctomycetes bacterium]|nr:hypothetical protein [Planctomycetota bacterium]